jgi:hypothetical protein
VKAASPYTSDPPWVSVIQNLEQDQNSNN